MMWLLWVSLYLFVGFLITMRIYFHGYEKITIGDLYNCVIFIVFWPITIFVLLWIFLDDNKDVVIFDFSKKVKK